MCLPYNRVCYATEAQFARSWSVTYNYFNTYLKTIQVSGIIIMHDPWTDGLLEVIQNTCSYIVHVLCGRKHFNKYCSKLEIEITAKKIICRFKMRIDNRVWLSLVACTILLFVGDFMYMETSPKVIYTEETRKSFRKECLYYVSQKFSSFFLSIASGTGIVVGLERYIGARRTRQTNWIFQFWIPAISASAKTRHYMILQLNLLLDIVVNLANFLRRIWSRLKKYMHLWSIIANVEKHGTLSII